MARFKFFLFALVVLGLWGWHLMRVSPLIAQGSAGAAQAAVAGAAGPVAVALENQRSLTQAIGLKVATSNAVLVAPKAGAPTAERLSAVKVFAVEGLPEGVASSLFVAVTNEAGTLWVKGDSEPSPDVPEGVGLAQVLQAGASGAVSTIDGADYLLFSAPLLTVDKNEVRAVGAAVVGLPVLPPVSALEQARAALNLTSLSLVADGKAVLTAGDAATAAEVLTKLKAGAQGPLASGPVKEIGPVQLPLLVEDLTHTLGARQAIGGTPFEVAAAAASKAALDELANYQVFGLGALAGLLLLSLAWLILIGGAPKVEAPAMSLPLPPPPPAPRDSQPQLPSPLPLADAAPAPEASPDDFDFPASSPGMPAVAPPPPPIATGQAPAFEPTSDPFAAMSPPPPPAPVAPPPPPAAPTWSPPPAATAEAPALQRPGPGALFDDDDEPARTVSYPAQRPPLGGPSADPFALAAAQEAPQDDEPKEDATRVAAIPSELLSAARSASGMTSERPAFRPPSGAMPKVAAIAPVAPAGGDEERHFQDVFRDFVATREKCREPADGLTYEKFRAKLVKNKEQLVAKYQSRTVRFAVYVKDGKAALKATPVKD